MLHVLHPNKLEFILMTPIKTQIFETYFVSLSGNVQDTVMDV